MITSLKRLEANEQAVIESAYVRGQEKGKAKRGTEIAINILKDGVPPESVAKYTGLALDYVKSLVRTG